MNEWRDFVNLNNELDKKKDRAERTATNKGQLNGPVMAKNQKKKIGVLDYIEKVKDMNEGDNIKLKEPFYPKRASPRQVGDLAMKLEEQRQMTGEMSTWNMLKAGADTPEAKKEIREIIRKDYKDNGPKDMDQDDLKWIGKGKVQTIYPEIKVPHIDLNIFDRKTPPEPELPLRDKIKVLADKRLENEQRAWDQQHGRTGITDLLRPK